MIRRPPRSTLFPTRRSSDLKFEKALIKFDKNRTITDEKIIASAKELQNVFNSLKKNKKRKLAMAFQDRKSTRLNSSHVRISYAVFCLKKKTKTNESHSINNI